MHGSMMFPTISRRILAAALAALFAVGCAPPEGERALVVDAAPARFRSLPIEYKIASTIPEEMRGEIRAAFQEWNDGLGVEAFRYAGVKELAADELDPGYTFDENVVLATNRSGALPTEEGAEANPGPLARTFLKGASSISDADIYLFEFEDNFVHGTDRHGDVYSLKSVVMHEAGHMLLGSEHSEDEGSIMTATLFPKGDAREKLALGESDVARFRAAYQD